MNRNEGRVRYELEFGEHKRYRSSHRWPENGLLLFDISKREES